MIFSKDDGGAGRRRVGGGCDDTEDRQDREDREHGEAERSGHPTILSRPADVRVGTR